MHWFIKFLIVASIFILIWIFFSLILPKILPVTRLSNTEVGGVIIGNQQWEGTIRITGDIITASNTIITIKPGTKVLVELENDKSNFDLLPWHLKSGINIKEEYHGVRVGEPYWDEGEKIQIRIAKLVAIGTKEQPIIIKSDTNDFGSPYDFNSINISSGILSNIFASNYRRLEIGENVTVRDSSFTNTGECSICINQASPSVINNSFGNSLRESVWIFRGSPQITDNLFSNFSGAGIKIDPQRIGSANISYNTFEMPQLIALGIVSGDEIEGGLISFNKFSGNSLISMPCDSRIKFFQNSLLGLISFSNGSCVGSYTFGLNYWGGSDIKTILSEKILQKESGFDILIPFVLKKESVVGKRD